MWHAYNLISVGDLVKSTTIRRVQSETATGILNCVVHNLTVSKGSSSSERIRLNLTIEVESIDFDSQQGILRLKGKNLTESQYVKVQYLHFSMSHLFTVGRLSYHRFRTQS